MLAIALLYGSDQITADKVFAITSYFSIIAHTMTQQFVRGIAEIAEALVALKRLQNFLELEEKQTKPIAYTPNGNNMCNGIVNESFNDENNVQYCMHG